MRLRELPIRIDPTSPLPFVQQIVEGLVRAIREGLLGPGTALPGSRALAEQLRVSRNTVVAAYLELHARGWITASTGSGSFVSDPLPTGSEEAPAAPRCEPLRQAFDLPTRPDLVTDATPKVFKLGLGLPDARLMAAEELGRAYNRALRRRGEEVLDYGDPLGLPELREALAAWLGERRGLAVPTEGLLVTRGNQMALSLVAQGLVKPGEPVGVEQPGNPQAGMAFIQAGARLVGLPVDEAGLDVDALERVLETEKLRLICLSPRYQIPTTVTLSPARRARLLALAQAHRFGIVEEDSEADYAFDGAAVPPLAAGVGAASVLHLASFSRLLAPGIRLGFIAGPPAAVDRLARVRQRMDRQGDLALERALAHLLKEGDLHRHVHRVRRIYEERREHVARELERQFADRLTWQRPAGGLSLWIRTAPDLDLPAWSVRCAQLGVQLQPGSAFLLDRSPLAAFPLGFGAHAPEEMTEILRRMREALPPSRA